MRFERVGFGYDSTPVLEGVDFALARGRRVALVGLSGAGKTTVGQLLLGFLAPTRGRVVVDGVDLATLPAPDWRARVAWLPQRPTLFHGTILDNIRLGCPDADPARVRRAIEQAEATRLIDGLPNGLDTVLGERGQGLSGGEVQRIALARVLLQDADVVVLDEPGAALDDETAAVVARSIDALSSRCALLVIAHRLETVRGADEILVLQGGTIVERGRHAAAGGARHGLCPADGPHGRGGGVRDVLRLLALCRPYARWMAAGVALNVVVILSNVGLLALAGWFIASMALSGVGAIPFEYFAPAAAIRGLAVLRTIGRYLERVVTHEATFRLIAELRVWFYARLEPLAPAGLQRHRGGDLLSRIRSDVDSLDTLYLRVLAPCVAAAVTVAALSGFLGLYSVRAAWILAGGLIAAGVAGPLVAQRLGREPGRRAVLARSGLRVVAAETVQGLGELLLAQADGRQGESVSRLGVALVREQRRQAWIGAALSALSGLAAQLCVWGTLVVLIPMVRAGGLPGPDLAMTALYVLASFEAVVPLPGAFLAFAETRAAARRIFELVDAAPAVAEPGHAAAAPRRFDLRMRGLRMRYSDDAPWALDSLDLDVASGEALGLVGANGSGKTSLLNVLLRFWEYEGQVAIGGVALRDLDGETARSLFGVVSQQTHLFNASVRDNLRLGRPDATDAVLADALRAAHLWDEIAALPDGLDTLAGENGARFSGGQARRLSIARALLKDAPILLLDEPTEGLDATSERAVLDALRTLMRGRTTLLITHRLAALRIVDRVVTLDHGRIRAWVREPAA